MILRFYPMQTLIQQNLQNATEFKDFKFPVQQSQLISLIKIS